MRAFFILALWAMPLFQGDAEAELRFLAGLAAKGMSAELEREASTFLRAHPDHPRVNEARYRLACAHFDLQRTEAAALILRDLWRESRFEFAAEVALRLGQCEMDLGRNDQAIVALDRALASDKDYLIHPARALRADALLAAGRIQEAERAFAQVLEQGSKAEYAADAACGFTWCAFKSRDFKAVLERSKQFLSQHAKHGRAPEVQFLRGEALLELGRAEDSLACYAKVGDGTFADAALRGQAFARASLGQHAAAAADFGALIERFPKSRFQAEARLQCAAEHIAAGDAQAALALLDSKSAAGGGELAYWRARALSAAGEGKAALELALGVGAREKDADLSLRWASLRADLLLAAGRPDEALAAYELAGSDYALQAGAVAALEAARPADAIRLARKLLERSPKSPYRTEAGLALAEGQFALGQHAPAEQAFLAAAEADGDPARREKSRLRAAWCRYLSKDAARSAAMFKELARTAQVPEVAEEASYMSARALEDAADLGNARGAYERYLERFPRGARRGEALLGSARLADGESAIERLEAALGTPESKSIATAAHFELAERLSKAGSFEEALPHYRAVLGATPPAELEFASHYGLAWCHFSSGRFKDASAAVELLFSLAAKRAGSLEGELAEASLELAVWSNVREKQLDRAANHWRALLDRSSNEQRVWSAARTLLRAWVGTEFATQREKVLADCGRKLKLPAVQGEIAAERALEAVAAGDQPAALKQLDAAWRAAPDSAAVREAACTVAETSIRAGDTDNGRQILRALVRDEKAAQADRAVYQLGFASLAAGDARAASVELARFDERFPKSALRPAAQFLGAEAQYRAGETDRALAQFEALAKSQQSAELAPKILFRLGVLHCQRGRWKEGEAELQRLTREHPRFENLLEAQLWLGRALAQRGEVAAANAALTDVAGKDSGMLGAQARLSLGEIALGREELESALAHFLRVAVLYNDVELVAEANWGAGRAFERSGELAKAIRCYREIQDKAPRTKLAANARERLEQLAAR